MRGQGESKALGLPQDKAPPPWEGGSHCERPVSTPRPGGQGGPGGTGHRTDGASKQQPEGTLPSLP